MALFSYSHNCRRRSRNYHRQKALRYHTHSLRYHSKQERKLKAGVALSHCDISYKQRHQHVDGSLAIQTWICSPSSNTRTMALKVTSNWRETL